MSKKSPLVSIIVPVYNVEKYIEECLDSLINQTYKNIEIIIVNDGSPDGSLKICKRYAKKDDRIKIISKDNDGLNMARSTGSGSATGEYIMFVDSDDAITETCVEDLYLLLVEHDTDIAVGGYEKFVNLKETLNKKNYYSNIVTKTKNEDSTLSWLFTGQLEDADLTGRNVLQMIACAKLYKREIISKTDWLFSNYWTNEDEFEILQWFSLAKNGVSITTKVVYFYRINPDSKTLSKYYNKNPEGKEIDKFELAYDLMSKSHQYLSNINKEHFYDSIRQRYVWHIQDGIAASSDNGTLRESSTSIIEAIEKLSRMRQEDYEEKTGELDNLINSTSWKITYPLRRIASYKPVRMMVRLVIRVVSVISHPGKIIGSVIGNNSIGKNNEK